MSWRIGHNIFLEVLDVIDRHDMDDEDRLEFKAQILRLFLDWDMDPCGLDDDPTIGPIYSRMEELEADSPGARDST